MIEIAVLHLTGTTLTGSHTITQHDVFCWQLHLTLSIIRLKHQVSKFSFMSPGQNGIIRDQNHDKAKWISTHCSTKRGQFRRKWNFLYNWNFGSRTKGCGERGTGATSRYGQHRDGNWKFEEENARLQQAGRKNKRMRI